MRFIGISVALAMVATAGLAAPVPDGLSASALETRATSTHAAVGKRDNLDDFHRNEAFPLPESEKTVNADGTTEFDPDACMTKRGDETYDLTLCTRDSLDDFHQNEAFPLPESEKTVNADGTTEFDPDACMTKRGEMTYDITGCTE